MTDDSNKCADCGAAFKSTEFVTGYGKDANGVRRCYDCITFLDVRDLQKREPTFAYLSALGLTVTNWTGGVLARVVRSKHCALSRLSFAHSASTYRTVWAVDVFGNYWIGRGSPGICIKLRPCKPPK